MADTKNRTLKICQDSQTRGSQYNKKLMEKLSYCRKHGKFTDWKIIVGDETIECHAMVVCAFSPVFERMIESAMTEEKKREVKYDTIHPDIMNLILNYMYTGEVAIEEHDLQEVLVAYDYLEVLDLRDEVLRKIEPFITVDNVLGWLKLALDIDVYSCEFHCHEVLEHHFPQVARGPEVMEMSLDELRGFLQENQEKFPSSLLHGVFSRINCDRENREETLDGFLEYLKPECCSRMVIREIIQQHKPIIDLNPGFHQVITWVYLQKTRSIDADASLKRSLLIMDGEGYYSTWKLVRTKSGNEFKRITSIPLDLSDGNYQALCFYEGVGVILTGGRDDACAIYSVAANKWKRIKTSTILTYSHICVCVDGELFVFGGMPDPSRDLLWSSDVERLDLRDENAEWYPVPSMPYGERVFKAVNIGSDVFLACHDWGSTIDLFHFDARNEAWSERSKLEWPDDGDDDGYNLDLAACDGKLYAAGGPACAVYDSDADVWMRLEKPSLPHEYGALVCYKNKLLLLGGGEVCEIEEYDVEKGKWTVLPYEVPQWMSHHIAEVI